MTPDQILNVINLVSQVLASEGLVADLIIHTEAGKEGVKVKITLDVNVPLKQNLQTDGKV